MKRTISERKLKKIMTCVDKGKLNKTVSRLLATRVLMQIAEDDLAQTFDEKQKALYKELLEKRELYFKCAREVYRVKRRYVSNVFPQIKR